MTLSICPCCQRLRKVEQRRRHTNYKTEDLNYLTSCKDCFKADCEMLDSLFKDYKGSVGFGDYID